MWSDKIIREAIWPTNGARPTVYVPEERAEFGHIIDAQLQPASLDLRLADQFIRHPDGQRFGKDARYPYVLSPGECVLATTVERFYMNCDNVVARIRREVLTRQAVPDDPRCRLHRSRLLRRHNAGAEERWLEEV